jgi:hypothetical protein
MKSARFLVAVLILAGAVLAACSGNFGSGTTPPNGLLPSGNLAGISPTPTPTPASASNIVTFGSTTAFQPLPSAAGYGGAIAFPVPSPKPSGFTEVAIGATLSVVRPADAPDLNIASKGKNGKKRERPARSLVYVTLLATHDITLDALPRIAIDVPREIVTVYRENEFGMALYNGGAKEGTFRLAVAELDSSSPPTPTPNPSAPPPPTTIPVSASASPSASPSIRPGASPTPLPSGVTPSPGASGVPASGAPAASPTLPPQRITFAGTPGVLKLTANRPVVFALYALPVATPAPSPRSSGASAAQPEPSASGAAPAASGSPEAKGSPEPKGT